MAGSDHFFDPIRATVRIRTEDSEESAPMFDHPEGFSRRIAVIGGGISGMSAAYYLSDQHKVTLFEAEPRLGGHARTVVAGRHGNQPVDTGFIVFNYATYPYLTRLFADLNVPVEKSEMSFAVAVDEGRVEFGLSSLRSLLAQKRNLARPAFYKMISDILRFGKTAETVVGDDDITVGALVHKMRLGRWFRDHYLLPMSGAIWSTPTEMIDTMPARALVRFFRNHALLAGAGKHQWWTVSGGSVEYVKRLEAQLSVRGCAVLKSTPLRNVKRTPLGVTVSAKGHPEQDFDEVIFACHSDQALALLGSGATKAEATALGAIAYQPNRAVLHADPGQMPKRDACWSSWNYRSQAGGIGVTYWMNRLQNIPEGDPLFITLNPTTEIVDHLIYDDVNFSHPVFDGPALRAQETLRGLQGQNSTWFAGAYNRHGFHEDGIASAMRVIRALNAPERIKGVAHADR